MQNLTWVFAFMWFGVVQLFKMPAKAAGAKKAVKATKPKAAKPKAVKKASKPKAAKPKAAKKASPAKKAAPAKKAE